MGDRRANLDLALVMLEESSTVQLGAVSSIYETAPVGNIKQADFYNIVAEIKTTATPHELLLLIQDIEARLGRTREVRWGPRTIDIDILLYDNVTVKDKDLVIPHLEMRRRAFVLEPLAEIAPDLILPTGEPVGELLEEVKGQEVKNIGKLI